MCQFISAPHDISSGGLIVAEISSSKKPHSYAGKLMITRNSVGAVSHGLDGPLCGLSTWLGWTSHNMVAGFCEGGWRGQALQKDGLHVQDSIFIMPISGPLAKASQIANPKVKVEEFYPRRHGSLEATKETICQLAVQCRVGTKLLVSSVFSLFFLKTVKWWLTHR